MSEAINGCFPTGTRVRREVCRCAGICQAADDSDQQLIVFTTSCPSGYHGSRSLYVRPKSGGSIKFELVAEAPNARRDQFVALLTAFDEIGPNARTLLLELAQRLVKGAREHGDFDPAKKKDWVREAFEEELDSIIYRALELQQR